MVVEQRHQLARARTVVREDYALVEGHLPEQREQALRLGQEQRVALGQRAAAAAAAAGRAAAAAVAGKAAVRRADDAVVLRHAAQ